MAQTIAVVDDDATLRNRLKKYLQSEGFTVFDAESGAALRDLLESASVDLIILDLVMPGEDGLSVTRYLRETTEVGILILTGKGEAVDRIVGLEMGADDYLAKPFELRELLARARSILRRVAANGDRPKTPKSRALVFDRWSLDLQKMELRCGDDPPIHLTSAEYRLLEKFTGSPGRTLSRDQLMDAVSERDWTPYDRSIDLHISNLRKKIERDPKSPELIKTVRGFGYVFTPAVTAG